MNDWYRKYARDDFRSNHWLQLNTSTCSAARRRAVYSGITAAFCSKNAALFKLF